jgi:fructose-specific component phosphotransferase system IIB-like protein
MGEVLYRIDADTATKILASTDKNYYLVNKSDPETVLYIGKFEDIANKSAGTVAEGDTILQSIDNQITGKNTILADLNEQINKANTQLTQAQAAAQDAAAIAAAQISQAQQTASQAVTAIQNQSGANAALLASLQAQAEQIQAQQAVLTQAQAAQQAAIQQAAQQSTQGGTPSVNIVEIPGVASFSLPGSLLASITPNVEKPAIPNSGFNKNTNPTTQGNTKML